MKRKELTGIYKSGFKKIDKYYHRLAHSFKGNDIHLFRVEIKKLRAFIRLVNLSGTHVQHKIPKSIKKLYQAFGSVRNLQLQQERITGLCRDLSIENPSAYLQCLLKLEKRSGKKASRLANSNAFKNFKKQLIEEAPIELSKQTKEAFIQKNTSRLVQLLALPLLYDETVHDVRKIIKDLVYNYEYLEFSISNIIPFALNNSEAMERLTSVLGDFQDLCVGLFLLDSINSNSPGETGVLDELKTHLRLRKESMMVEVLKSLAPVRQQFQSQRSATELGSTD